MQITAEHNLSPTELSKALHGIAEAEGITEELVKALKKTGACDLTPKLPKDKAIRQIYDMLTAEFAKAAADVQMYAEEIASGKMIIKSIEVHAHERHFKDGHETLVSTFYRIGDHHGQHVLTRHEADRLPHPHHYDTFHGTTEAAAHNIVANGFDTSRMRNGQYYGNGVYTTPNPEEADFWANRNMHPDDKPVILRVKVVAHHPAVMQRSDYERTINFYLASKHILEQANGDPDAARKMVLQYRRSYFTDKGHDVLVLKAERPDNMDFGEWMRRTGGNQTIAFSHENVLVIK